MMFLCMLLLALALWPFTAIESIVYKTTKMECPVSPVYLRNVSCKLKPINRYKAVSNMVCDLAKTLRNITLHLKVLWKNSANIYTPFLIDITANLCDALDRKSFPAYAMIAVNILKRVSNVNHSCPYDGRLFAKNLYLDEKFIPMLMPLGSYKVILEFSEGYPYEDIGKAILYVDVMEPQTYSRKIQVVKV